jgi:hypothetical protein
MNSSLAFHLLTLLTVQDTFELHLFPSVLFYKVLAIKCPSQCSDSALGCFHHTINKNGVITDLLVSLLCGEALEFSLGFSMLSSSLKHGYMLNL